MIRATLLGLCLLLGACAARTPLPLANPSLVAPLPLSLHVQREQAGQHQDWLLVLQADGEALHWSLLDPLGVPLARQRLSHGQWRDDGLLPPNAEARELFAALLFALTPAAALPSRYTRGSWAQTAEDRRRLNPAWRIRYRAPLDFTLHNPPGPRYRVRPLAPEEGS
ncbi:DUF3261 domain-containing protein [Pseudomonas lalucatii]|nr:DUF3261 domain-containing protein [Pseudomonas lalucatii]